MDFHHDREKNAESVLRCGREPFDTAGLLEVPQWMFDPVACCRIFSATSPAVSCEALRELKHLLAQAPAARQRDMVQAEHHPLLRTGGADATPDQPATGRSIRPVSSFSEDATVDAPAAGGPAGGGAFAGATAAATPSRGCSPSYTSRRCAMSDKIRAQHLTRKAMLYVRQSSAYQVSHNLESQKLQYAMQDRLHQLGWNEIEVIDEDLGRSAAGTQTRTGFERMVAEVWLGHVGAVAAREVSRFARNSREWQQLVEVCRVQSSVDCASTGTCIVHKLRHHAFNYEGGEPRKHDRG
jgi:hypothetical protein